MNAAHWETVERVLDAVLEHDPSQWSARLDEFCGDDVTVRRDVEALLSHYTSAQRFLDSPPPRRPPRWSVKCAQRSGATMSLVVG